MQYIPIDTFNKKSLSTAIQTLARKLMIKSLGIPFFISFAHIFLSQLLTCAACLKGEPHCRADPAQAAAGEMTYSETELSVFVLPWPFKQDGGFRMVRTMKSTDTKLTLSLMAYSRLCNSKLDNQEDE